MPKSWHTVAIADLESRPECAHRAYLDPEEEWNGWACPYFEKSEVERMAAWLLEFDDGLVYSTEDDTFTTTYDPDLPEAFKGEDVGGMHLYPIGAGSWIWVIVDGESTPASEDSAAASGTIAPSAAASPEPRDPAQHVPVD
ncbi:MULTISPECIES: hypothetical protein [unclassified Collinsella]|uniref:hypothetical protein n=1 Tax=unclassified Collinsella TaxID=2637548 RepID=UPI00319E66D7